MNATEMMLAGYYVKAGAPHREAQLVASLFGSRYLELQSKRRIEGAGNKSKALAAADICDFVATGASLYHDFMIWDLYKSPLDLVRVVDIVGAANICRAAVYAYALDTDVTEAVMDDANQFLGIACARAENAGIPFDKPAVATALHEQIKHTVISSAALGSRKGIWSKIFG